MFFLSTFWKTYIFSSKKYGKSLEVICKSCTFALAFQNYGARLMLGSNEKRVL